MRCSSPKIFHINVSHLVIPTHWINRLHTHTHYTHCLVEASQMFRCKNSYLVRLRFSGYKSSWLCVFLCDRWNSRLLISFYVDWHCIRAFEHRSKVLVTINSVEMCVFVVMYLWRRHTHTQKQNMASFPIPKRNNPVQMNHHATMSKKEKEMCIYVRFNVVWELLISNSIIKHSVAAPLFRSEWANCISVNEINSWLINVQIMVNASENSFAWKRWTLGS